MWRTKISLLCCLIVTLTMMAAGVTSGQESSTETSVEGGKIWVDEQTGSILPLDLVFSNEQGEPVTLGSLFDKPIILLPIYFYCPNSCSTNLANLAGAMNRMKLEAGKDYRAIALSFNEKDSAKDAQDAKNNYLPLLYKGFPGEQWNFLTGSHQNISQLLDVIGYNFKPLDDGTFIHPSALITASEDGMVIKYVYGNFIPGDVEMAVSEAQKGTPALSVKRLLNFCFNYDPDANKSYFQTVKVVVLLVFSLSVFVFFLLFIRKKKSDRSS